MTGNRRLRWFILALLLYCTFCSVGGVILADGALHPARRNLTREDAAAYSQRTQPLHARVQDVSIAAPDASILRGWMVRPQQPNGDAVLLLHGLGDNRLGMTGYAQILLAHGYTVLLPDARAQGVSGGDLATYGLLERHDIAQWVDLLRADTGAHCVYGMGESMGAAELLQSLSAGATFCAVVAESAFANFREIAYDRMGQPFHLGPWAGRTVLRPGGNRLSPRALEIWAQHGAGFPGSRRRLNPYTRAADPWTNRQQHPVASLPAHSRACPSLRSVGGPGCRSLWCNRSSSEGI